MMDASRVDRLVSLCERRRSLGQPLTDEELQDLCRQHPEDVAEVRRQLALLQAADKLLDLPSAHPSQVSTLLEHRPATPLDGADRPADLPACVGRYVVGRELKQGGMGRIVRVWDEDFKRPLALKMVRGRHAGQEQRLVYEGRLTGCLQHPGIPPVHDQGRLPDRRPYFVMKLIQGASLSELLGQRTSAAAELPRFLLIFEQLCDAVGYAHSRRVIHRDLKPGNVMVGAFGEVQVIDWGLAKLISSDPAAATPAEEVGTVYGLKQTAAAAGAQTTADTVLGTPAYMAPEQAHGDVHALDTRADVFGLGAILCEVLTGRPPYGGPDVLAILDQAKRADLADALASLKGCGADGDLLALARACLAAGKEDRPADGAAVAQAVAAYRQEVQRRLKAAEIEAAAQAIRAEEEKKLRVAESARAEEEARRRQAERQRRRVAVALAAAVVLLVLGASAAALWYQGQRVQQQTERELRSAYLNQEVRSALDESENALKQLHTSLDDPLRAHELLSDVERWRWELQTAEAAWTRAHALAAGGDELLEADVPSRLGRLEDRVAREKAAWALAEALDEVRLKAATLAEGKYEPDRSAREYPNVLAAAGWDVTRGEPAALAARIVASPARYAIVAALDDWASATSDRNLRARLLAIG